MNILCLDMSLNHTGFAVFSDNNLLESGVIEPKRKDKDMIGEERIEFIRNYIESLLVSTEFNTKNKVEVVVIEDYGFGARGRAVFDLGELGGVVKNYFFKLGIKVVKVAPTALKKFVTGSGRSDKNVMLMKIYKKYGKEFLDDNEADAYALGKYYFEVVKNVNR